MGQNFLLPRNMNYANLFGIPVSNNSSCKQVLLMLNKSTGFRFDFWKSQMIIVFWWSQNLSRHAGKVCFDQILFSEIDKVLSVKTFSLNGRVVDCLCNRLVDFVILIWDGMHGDLKVFLFFICVFLLCISYGRPLGVSFLG